MPPAGGAYVTKSNPASCAPLCLIPDSSAEDVKLAAAAAKQAQPAWRSLSFEARADYLDAIARGLESRLEELVVLESEDTGKPVTSARHVDIPRAISNFRFFSGAIRHDELAAHHQVDAINYTTRTAVGVAGLITPWNLPLYLLSWKVAPALAMGNTVVCKPSEITPRTASVLAEVCKEVGLPDGVFNLVHGLGASAGQAMSGGRYKKGHPLRMNGSARHRSSTLI